MMDTLWIYIAEFFIMLKNTLNFILGPINAVHPGLSIFILAVITYFIIRELRKRVTTKRYKKLEQDFNYWYEVRQQALNSSQEDKKSALLAKNIDKAQLDKIYYDYFLEGLLISLITTSLPLLSAAVYVNAAYNPAQLELMLNQKALFQLNWLGGQIQISALFWFFICLVGLWTAIKLGPKLTQLKKYLQRSLAAKNAGSGQA